MAQTLLAGQRPDGPVARLRTQQFYPLQIRAVPEVLQSRVRDALVMENLELLQ